MAVQWIFFDVGYTLVNEDAVWLERCREQAALTPGLTPEEIFAAIIEASRAYLPQYRTVADRYGFARIAPYREALETLYPDALPTLQALCGPYRLGVIANQSAGLEDRLKFFGIRDYFSCVVSSWESGVMKPDPAIFRLALERAICPADQALMVGDRLDNDIFPAKALGMKTIWIRQGLGAYQTPRGPAYTPDGTVDRLSDLPGVVSAL